MKNDFASFKVNKSASGNSIFVMRARHFRTQSRSLCRINEVSTTKITSLSREKWISGGAHKIIFLALTALLILAGCNSGSSGYKQPAAISGMKTSACLTTEGNGGVANMPGFYIKGGKLYDGTGNEFIMRGINYPHAWFSGRYSTSEKLADIASTCANTVRIVLANGEQWQRTAGKEVAELIAAAKANNLVAMLEVHDATGYGEKSSAANPQTAVDYWLSEDIRAAIDGEEGYVIINIANEPFGNFPTPQRDAKEWVNFHTSAVMRLRTAGLPHTLVVDAPNWGQDWTNTMRDGSAAQTIFDSDIKRNVVFSVHMYDMYGTEEKVEAYLQAFVVKKLPLIVGEFAADHGMGKEVAEAAILSSAQKHGMGYLGWSWSGNSDSLGSLDIVNDFDVNKLSSWGETLINSKHGIRATSTMCSCYKTRTVK